MENNYATELICSTCLCTDRKLYPLRQLLQFQLVLDNLKIPINKDRAAICWECKAILKKAHMFKIQATNANQFLTSHLKVNDLEKLSNMGISDITYTVIYNNTEVDKIETNTEEIPLIKDEQEDFLDDTTSNTSIKSEFCTEMANETGIVQSDESKNQPTEDYLTKIIKVESKIGNEYCGNNLEASEIHDENCQIAHKMFLLLDKKFKNVHDTEICKVLTLSKEELIKCREAEKKQFENSTLPYKCMTCLKIFKSFLLLEMHNSKFHFKGNNFKCTICHSRFESAKKMFLHTRHHYYKYECLECSYITSFKPAMKTHYIKTHSKKENGQDLFSYTCKHCKLQFQTRSKLKYHKRTHNKNKPECDYCGRVFTTKDSLKSHILVHTGVPMFKCAICNGEYSRRSGLIAHMRTHVETPSENAYCAECDVQYKNIYIYRRHLKTNSKHVSKMYKCTECGKEFLDNTYLNHHMKLIHYKISKYTCNRCNKIFVSNYKLKRHIEKVHEKLPQERRFPCPFCDKTFAIKTVLQTHIYTHTGERPYQCKLCPSNFSSSASLYNHNRLIHKKIKIKKDA